MRIFNCHPVLGNVQVIRATISSTSRTMSANGDGDDAIAFQLGTYSTSVADSSTHARREQEERKSAFESSLRSSSSTTISRSKRRRSCQPHGIHETNLCYRAPHDLHPIPTNHEQCCTGRKDTHEDRSDRQKPRKPPQQRQELASAL